MTVAPLPLADNSEVSAGSLRRALEDTQTTTAAGSRAESAHTDSGNQDAEQKTISTRSERDRAIRNALASSASRAAVINSTDRLATTTPGDSHVGR